MSDGCALDAGSGGGALDTGSGGGVPGRDGREDGRARGTPSPTCNSAVRARASGADTAALGEDARGATLGDADARGATLGEDARGAALGEDAPGATLGEDARGATLGDADARGATLGEDARGATLGDADARGATLGEDARGATLGDGDSNADDPGSEDDAIGAALGEALVELESSAGRTSDDGSLVDSSAGAAGRELGRPLGNPTGTRLMERGENATGVGAGATPSIVGSRPRADDGGAPDAPAEARAMTAPPFEPRSGSGMLPLRLQHSHPFSSATVEQEARHTMRDSPRVRRGPRAVSESLGCDPVFIEKIHPNATSYPELPQGQREAAKTTARVTTRSRAALPDARLIHRFERRGPRFREPEEDEDDGARTSAHTAPRRSGKLNGSDLPVDKNERRQMILSHAREVFAKRGYHAAKIDDIVAAAGVARGTFYLHFEDKRSIFEEIVDEAFARLGAAVVRVDTEDPGRTVADQVVENIRRIVHTLLADPGTTKILLSDAVGLDPRLDEKLLSFYEGVGQLLESSLIDGQERGLVATGDPRTLAIMTLGAVKELVYQKVMRGLDYSEARIVEEIYRFLSVGVLRVRP